MRILYKTTRSGSKPVEAEFRAEKVKASTKGKLLQYHLALHKGGHVDRDGFWHLVFARLGIGVAFQALADPHGRPSCSGRGRERHVWDWQLAAALGRRSGSAICHVLETAVILEYGTWMGNFSRRAIEPLGAHRETFRPVRNKHASIFLKVLACLRNGQRHRRVRPMLVTPAEAQATRAQATRAAPGCLGALQLVKARRDGLGGLLQSAANPGAGALCRLPGNLGVCLAHQEWPTAKRGGKAAG